MKCYFVLRKSLGSVDQDQMLNLPTKAYTVKLVLSDHIKQGKIVVFHTGGCLMQDESDAENSCTFVLH